MHLQLHITRAIGIVAIIATSGSIGLSPETASGANDTSRNSLNYREVLQCGPNSLFMFLILSGHSEVTLEQLRELPMSSDGTSLLALRDAARRFGVDTEIRRYSRDGVASISSLPAIVQFQTSETSLTPFHFDVLYKVDADSVYLLNGTTGFKFSVQRSRLPNFWTGFALVGKWSLAEHVKKEWQPALLVACLLIANFFIFSFW